MHRFYKNKKNGNLYLLLAYATDTTNERDGMSVAIYCPDDQGNEIYVRDLEEFNEKFYPVSLEEEEDEENV